jgi:hypothetical protein
MDMEELSKSQIVLLTLLVSFVTSIATGIVTVSLMDQAPPAIAQTVNRIIEHTVEKVVPGEQTAAAAVTKETTVVVKESDLIVQAVEKISPSVVRIYTTSSEPVFLGLGVVYDAGGTMLADASAVGGQSDMTAVFSDGTRLTALPGSSDDNTGVAFLRPATTTVADKPYDFKPASLATGQAVLGESVILLSGKTVARIADGLVTALVPHGENKYQIIDTNISPGIVIAGSPLVNTEGVLIGVSTGISRASSEGGFIPSSVLMKKDSAEAQ